MNARLDPQTLAAAANWPGLRRLRLFDAVCRAGGISQAAAAVGLSQPAVSLAIKKLEQSWGAALLERGVKGSELSPTGRALQRRVGRMLEQLEAAMATAQSGARSRTGSAAASCRHLSDGQIHAHIAIAELGSAAEAARRLGISQPAVHRAARELEDNVGVALYRRHPHRVSANAAGLELARRLLLALHEIEQARFDLASAGGNVGGRIAVGVLPLMPQRLLARTIGQLHATHPDVAVSLREGAHARLLDDLRYGRLDLIVGALREPRLHDGVCEQALFDDPYVVVVRRGHALAAQRRPSAEALCAHGWILPQHDMPRRAVVETLLETLPRRPPVVLETSSLAMMMAMLEEYDCISLLSRSHILDGHFRDDVVSLDIELPGAGRTVGITTRADWLPTPPQQAFIERLGAQCRAQAMPPARQARREPRS